LTISKVLKKVEKVGRGRLRESVSDKLEPAIHKGARIEKENTMWDETRKIYDQIVERCPRFERKGKTMPYTSANGHMFSLLNKAGELGFRYAKLIQVK